MPRTKDMLGERYGRLTVAARSDRKSRKGAMWICRCDCGGVKIASREYLIRGTVRSCGCLAAEQVLHGKSNSPEQKAWAAAKKRCYNPKCHNYPHYGGRGIRMCDRWRFGEGGKSGFHCFLIDVGHRPDGGVLDRIDNDGNYEPGNVRWSTLQESNNNQQRTVWIEWGGERLSMANFCRKHGIPYQYFRSRYSPSPSKIRNGERAWSVEKIVTRSKKLFGSEATV